MTDYVVLILLVGRYLSELLAERHKLNPFMPVLPNTYRLLNQGQLQNLYIIHCYFDKKVMVARTKNGRKKVLR